MNEDPSLHPDTWSNTAWQEVLNRSFVTSIASKTGGLSPAALMQARQDWLLHLIVAPGKQLALVDKALRKGQRLANHMVRMSGRDDPGCCIEPLAQDKRFRHPAWHHFPYNLISQSFLLQQQWWHNATTGVPGVTAHHERILEFTTRQVLDMFSPSNFLATNPEVLEQTIAQGGQNLWTGMQNFLEDLERERSGHGPAGAEFFRPGHEVAITPGNVVHRNRLMELIQYSPTSEQVHPEPILIVPAWINKYYILDLSPANSLVRYLVGQGFTVFMISWVNPGPNDRDMSMDDYRKLGVDESLQAINAIAGKRPVHGVGYCLGGTLLAIAAAARARAPVAARGSGSTSAPELQEPAFASLTFLATQFDFTEPGELQLFIDESQLNFLDSMMWEQGFLDAQQMSGAFRLLNSNDLIWSHNMRTYLMGERGEINDLMAWNADSTRMPYRMHADYLRRLYLDNDLATGRFVADGKPVSLTDIRVPVFSVGTISDHVAPWQSVYKMHHLLDTDVTFALTAGGHNAGIISEPGHPRRSYQIGNQAADDKHVPAQTWAERTAAIEGSWWPAWADWLADRSSATVLPPLTGASVAGYSPLAAAPGTYVLMK